jgi:hypothetical protein
MKRDLVIQEVNRPHERRSDRMSAVRRFPAWEYLPHWAFKRMKENPQFLSAEETDIQ